MTPFAVALSDFHFTLSPPTCRTEQDIVETQKKKLRKIVNVANQHDVPIVCGGDFFDTWKCSHETVNVAASILRDLERPFLSVFGQHELPYHDPMRKMSSSLSSLLFATGKDLTMTPHTIRVVDNDRPDGLEVAFYGLSWGEEITGTLNMRHKAVNILVLHDTFWKGKPPFPTNEDKNVVRMIKEEPFAKFDVIVSGDYHQHFMHKEGSRVWLNCGCVFRTAANEADYIPRAWLLSLGAGDRVECDPINLPFAPTHVTRAHIEDKKEKEEMDSLFIEHLETTSFSFDYETAIGEIIEELQPSIGVRRKVKSAIHEGNLVVSEKNRTTRKIKR